MTTETLNTFMRAEVDAVVICIGLVVFTDIRRKRGARFAGSREFAHLLTLTILINFLDLLCWALSLDKSGRGVALRSAAFFVYYLCNNFIPYLWALYVVNQINKKKRHFRLLDPMVLPFAVSLLFLLLNPFIHDIYRIGAGNLYERGSLFFVNVVVCYLYMLFSVAVLLRNSQKLDRKRLKALLLFHLPPFVGSVIQFSMGGIDLLWAGAMVSILIIYFGTMNQKMNLDYLTGVYNRMQADLLLDEKIDRSTKDRTFSGIMIDVDHFKEINDKFGHHTGDEALEITVKLLRRSLGKQDFLARFGGDEFLVLLQTDSSKELLETVKGIERSFEHFNQVSHRPFELSLSMGYDVYDYGSGFTRAQFVRHIDRLMYRQKRSRRKAVFDGEFQ